MVRKTFLPPPKIFPYSVLAPTTVLLDDHLCAPILSAERPDLFGLGLPVASYSLSWPSQNLKTEILGGKV